MSVFLDRSRPLQIASEPPRSEQTEPSRFFDLPNEYRLPILLRLFLRGNVALTCYTN